MEGEISTFTKISKKTDYEGKWVVILNKRVIFSGAAEQLKKEMKKIRKKHPNDIPLIAKVPRKIMQIV